MDLNEVMANSPINPSKTLKSFWNKPEGKIGMVLTACFVAAGALIFWAKVLPWLLIVAQNTFFLALILIGIGILIFPFTQSDVRLRISIAYKIFLKKLAGFIIKTDPIAVLKVTIKKGEDRLDMFSEQIGKLKEILANLKRKVSTYKSQAEESMLAAQEAKKQNIKSQVYINANQAGRLQGVITY